MGGYPPSDPADALKHIRQTFPRYAGGMKATFYSPDEALHFWLGGPKGNGWSANSQNPFEAGGARIGPFFEFDQERLKGHIYKPRKYNRAPYVYVRPDEDGNYTGPSGSCHPFPGVNPKSFQIHCPGLDGKFGSGGSLTDSTGYTKERWDDMGNFCNFTLEDEFR